jgi:hypothetical protein
MTAPLTIDWLRQINPHSLEDPPGWTADAALRETREFQAVVEAELGRVAWASNAGEATFAASGTIPPAAMLEPRNIFAGVMLSNFQRLFTVTYPWDVKPELLARLIAATEKAGFTYVPFSLFADPATYDWRHDEAFMNRRTRPPAGMQKLRHEEVWTSLFGYL